MFINIQPSNEVPMSIGVRIVSPSFPVSDTFAIAIQSFRICEDPRLGWGAHHWCYSTT